MSFGEESEKRKIKDNNRELKSSPANLLTKIDISMTKRQNNYFEKWVRPILFMTPLVDWHISTEFFANLILIKECCLIKSCNLLSFFCVLVNLFFLFLRSLVAVSLNAHYELILLISRCSLRSWANLFNVSITELCLLDTFVSFLLYLLFHAPYPKEKKNCILFNAF